MKILGTLFILSWLVALLLLPSSERVDAQEKPNVPKEPEKKEFINYEALLNDKLSKGITPEKNAVVLLWKAIGPKPEGSGGMPPAFFKRLGIEEPPKNGDYFVDLTSYLKKHPKLDQEAHMDVWAQLEVATKRPWEEKQHPHIAGWLKANEKHLTLIIEACNLPGYYNPLVPNTGSDTPGWIVGVLLPAVQKSRELALALTARAMLSTFAAKHDTAWSDLLACHRLGRQVVRGGTSIEFLVGIAVERTATGADLAFLQADGMTSLKIAHYLKRLQELPPMPSLADKIDLTERICYLQVIQCIRRDASKLLNGVAGTPDNLTEEEKKILANLDWDSAIKSANRWFDRIVAAMRLNKRPDREKELEKIGKELENLILEASKSGTNSKLKRSKNEAAGEAGEAINNVYLGLVAPAYMKLTNNQDRSLQTERNLQVAFALAAYKQDQGRYPAKLTDLSPKYLATIPDDLFSGKALIYKPSEKGYLLYSVGENGKDEDGRGKDDEPDGDDLSVKMPLPPLKK